MASRRRSARSWRDSDSAPINEMVGHTECLRQREVPDHPKANTLNLAPLLVDVAKDDATMVRHATRSRNDGPEDRTLDDIILQDAKDAISDGRPISLTYKITNINRSVGTQVSGEIGYQYGEDGLPDGTIELRFTGSAGQSFGTFLAPGVRLILTGEANDYVGKGMSGGEIVIKATPEAEIHPVQMHHPWEYRHVWCDRRRALRQRARRRAPLCPKFRRNSRRRGSRATTAASI